MPFYRWPERDSLIVQSVVFEDASEREYTAGILIFITETSLALGALRNYEQMLNRVVSLPVPKFADYCLLDIVGEGGALQRAAVAHRDPDKERLMLQLRGCSLEPEEMGEALQLFRGKSPEAMTGTARESVLALSPVSCISVPLVVREQKLGVITFVTAESGRCYSQPDLTLAKLISRHFAVAIDNARQFEAVEQALQEARAARACEPDSNER